MSDPIIVQPPAAASANRLLAALPDREYQRLLPKLALVPLVYADVLYEPGDQIRHVYFPTSGVVSLLAATADQATLEVGIVGAEGVIGLALFLGVNTSLNQALVQGGGAAMRMKTADYLAECSKNPVLARLLKRFAHSLLTQISQSALCCRFHPIDQRLARWLLTMRDRMEADEFRLTHEFMSNMVGARREAVTKAAGAFQRQNLISLSRGSLSILNRTGLTAAACSCYEVVKAETEAVFAR